MVIRGKTEIKVTAKLWRKTSVNIRPRKVPAAAASSLGTLRAMDSSHFAPKRSALLLYQSFIYHKTFIRSIGCGEGKKT